MGYRAEGRRCTGFTRGDSARLSGRRCCSIAAQAWAVDPGGARAHEPARQWPFARLRFLADGGALHGADHHPVPCPNRPMGRKARRIRCRGVMTPYLTSVALGLVIGFGILWLVRRDQLHGSLPSGGSCRSCVAVIGFFPQLVDQAGARLASPIRPCFWAGGPAVILIKLVRSTSTYSSRATAAPIAAEGLRSSRSNSSDQGQDRGRRRRPGRIARRRRGRRHRRRNAQR